MDGNGVGGGGGETTTTGMAAAVAPNGDAGVTTAAGGIFAFTIGFGLNFTVFFGFFATKM